MTARPYDRSLSAGLSAALLSFALTMPMAVAADPYPSKAIQLFSPLPVGGSTDAATRAWMACVSKDKLAGQPIVLLNRPGGNGVIAASIMRKQRNDGYSLYVAGMSQMTITPFIFRKPPYDPEKDFEGATIFGSTPFLLVTNTQSGIRSIKDLQALGKANPDGVDLGIPAIATPAHLLSAALADRLGIKATLIPEGSEPSGMAALIGGQLHAMIVVAGSATQLVQDGRLVPLMSFTEQRLPEFPRVPSVLEELGDRTFIRYGWLGIAAPHGVPEEVIKAVEGWTKACLETPEFQQALRNALFKPRFVSASEFGEVVRRDIAFWKPWITRLGIAND